MKKIFTLVCTAVALFAGSASNAQSFTRPADTVHLIYTGSGVQSVSDNIAVPGATDVTVNWKVISCNFPSDWLSAGSPGMCDVNLCYDFVGNGIWPGGATQTCTYTHGVMNGDYHFNIALVPTSGTPATTHGTYYATARIANASNPNDSVLTTFAITWGTGVGIQNTPRSTEDVLLYPNPASNEINFVYDANADIKTIAVYNVIGKVMMVYRVQGNSANLNLETIPTGIYFARLVNAKGEVVVTRKFTKQ